MNHVVALVLLLGFAATAWLACSGGTRLDQQFTKADMSSFGQDRYECMQRHDRMSNYIACMGAKGYQHVK
jgi:hypothetical protein